MSTTLGELIVKYAEIYKKYCKNPMRDNSLSLELYELETDIMHEILHTRYQVHNDKTLRDVVHKAHLFDDIKRICEKGK